MKIQYFRIPDIATRTGVPETDVSRYLEVFADFFTWWEDGGERLYTPDALYLVEIIGALAKEGMTPEAIRAELDRRFPQILEDRKREPKKTGCPSSD